MQVKAAFYIDGFNLYYAIRGLKKPHLKLVNLFALCNSLIPQKSELLVRVVFFTAYKKFCYQKLIRHQKYVKALTAVDVESVFGHPITEPVECRSCHHTWEIEREKATDIGIALRLILDGLDGVYEHAYLVTADSDQAATAEAFKGRLPGKRLTSVCPPGRNFSTHILGFADAQIQLTEEHLERNLLPQYVLKDGKVIVERPLEYIPPK